MADDVAVLIAHANEQLWAGHGLEAARTAHRAATRAGTHVAEAELALGASLYMDGRRSALPHLERARELGHPQAGYVLVSALQALRRMDEAIALAAELAPGDAIAAWLHARLVMLSTGDCDDVLDVGLALLDEDLGGPSDSVRVDVALALADTGRDAEAVAVLDAAVPHSPWGRGLLLWARANVALAAGRFAHAAVTAGEAVETAAPDLVAPAELVRDWGLVQIGKRPLGQSSEHVLPLLDAVPIESEALLALADGDLETAEREFRRAARRWNGQSVRDQRRALAGAANVANIGHGEVQRTRPQLTLRERQTLELVAGGATSEQIAARLGLARSTVESHIAKAMAKLGARTRAQAAASLTPRGRRHRGLSPHEQRVVDLLAQGVSVTEAARLLYLSRRTLTRQLAELRRRLGVDTNSELIA